MKKQLFLDCDGVLADFDGYFFSLTGKTSEQFIAEKGDPAFWKTIAVVDNFFAKLKPMPDAFELYDAVASHRPIILTGAPRGSWALPQKLAWRDKYFKGVPMVVCSSKNKKDYCRPGDTLIDDMVKYKHLWESAGGSFILHTDAKTSIEKFLLTGE